MNHVKFAVDLVKCIVPWAKEMWREIARLTVKMKELDTEECHGNIEANFSIYYWRTEKKETTQSEVYPQACYFIYIFDLVLKKENKQTNKIQSRLQTKKDLE